MAYTIAVAGKGGTGKTTLAALVIRYLAREMGRPVLAVDADPNATLGLMLGVEPGGTIADIRDDVVERRVEMPAGASRDRHIEYCIHQSITEAAGFDLLTMGRPEGPKCYCYVNSLLRKYLDQASADYAFVVIDNEAGMEHLSRRTTNNVDLLFVVAEPTVVGVQSAVRILDLASKLPVAIGKKAVVLNRVPCSRVHPSVLGRLADAGFSPDAFIISDPAIEALSIAGEGLLGVDDANAAYRAISAFVAAHLAAAPNMENAYAGS